MKKFLLLALAFLLLTRSTENEVCKSTGKFFNCICKNRENFTLGVELLFDISYVSIKGCEEVSVPLGAMTHLPLEEIEFLDIGHLIILPFAFAGVESIQNLIIENIANFDVKNHGFAGLSNVQNIFIKNSTSKSLPMGAFSEVLNINYFLIENSTFYAMEEAAFVIRNVTVFKVINSYFPVVRNISIVIHSTEEVVFESCEFHEVNNYSFSMSFVDSLTFQQCKFGILVATFILAKDLESFSFKNCTVEVLRSGAFASVNASKKMDFTNNIVKIADNDSLISGNVQDQLQIQDCCNSFTCDCGIYWMWTSVPERYDELRKKSKCIGSPDKKISDLKPILDSSGNCKTLEVRTMETSETRVMGSRAVVNFPTNMTILIVILFALERLKINL